MLRLTLRFPLGVYYALGVTSRANASPRAEWPPSPVRVIGALLGAAHEVSGTALDADRALIRRLGAARPPWLVAPRAVHAGEQRDDEVAELRGPSRWAPRNPEWAELKQLSPRVVGRTRTEVEKAGVAIGDRPVRVIWDDVELTDDELRRLRRLAAEVPWLGTSRSPVLIDVDTAHDGGTVPQVAADELAGADSAMVWSPLPWATAVADAQLRVPTGDTVGDFDASFAARRSERGGVERAGHLRPAHAGRLAPYACRRPGRDTKGVIDPRQWGAIIVLALDDDRSELRPRTPATYLFARATRTALLSAFADRGEPGEAPGVLTARGGDPHVAVMPLPFVGAEHADGGIRGVAVVLPHPDRCPQIAEERAELEVGLRALVAGDGRHVQIPGAGKVWLRVADWRRDRLWTLNPERYTSPAKRWVTVTPVVHSLRRTSSGPSGIRRQVAADCAHVGLPEPTGIEVLSGPAVRGGAARLAPASETPAGWRESIAGYSSHLRLEFDRPVLGPVLLGRARHFGVGLCVPELGE